MRAQGVMVFGLDHPTWARPDCFFYATVGDAHRAIQRVYGEGTEHVVVRMEWVGPAVVPTPLEGVDVADRLAANA